jgi:16S rRNA processing protein RimM
VVTDTGHGLGKLTDVLNTPANDVYVTESGVLVPAVPAFIQGVDLEMRRITVHDLPGLREGT